MTRFALFSVTALGLILSACGEPPAPPADPIRGAKLLTVAARSGPAQREFVGRVEARLTVDMAFQVGGRLTELPVAEGAVITEGDLLARLEQQDYERAFRSAQVELQQARTALERQQTLHDRGISADAALEDAQTDFDLAEVAVQNARQNLTYTTIRAPFDALVSRRLVDNYTTVAGGQPVMRLQDISELRVAISVPEALVAQFDKDDVVTLRATFPFLPDQRFDLEYRELVAEPQATAQTYSVILALPDNIPANILPGMTASVFVTYDQSRAGAGIALPLSALDSAPDGSFRVWVYDAASGEVHARTVETRDLAQDQILITEGLEPGEQVVTAGVTALSEGMKVRPMASATRTSDAQR